MVMEFVGSPREWYRDNFMLSTSQKLLQPSAINDAFDTDDVYWVNRMPEDSLKKMLSNSLCLGLYALPESSSQIAGRSTPAQIGLARVITDGVSFAYVTDVYILKEYRGKGLGTWLIECLRDVLHEWPNLRGTSLMTSDQHLKDFYAKILGTAPISNLERGLEFLLSKGPGSAL